MGDTGLRPEERKLKSLISSLDLVSPDDLDRAADDVRLIRQYDGTVDLKQRLMDLELVGPRQLDAIERGLGMKAGEQETAKEEKQTGAAGGSEAGSPDGKTYINMSRLTGGASSGPRGKAGLGNLRLGTSGQQRQEGFHQRPIPGAQSADKEMSDKDKEKADHKAIKGGFVPSWKKGNHQEEPEEEKDAKKKASASKPAPGGPPTIAEQEERLKHIIRHIIHTRQHEQVLDFLVRRKMNVVEPAEVAKALDMGQRRVRQILDDLKASHVIKDIGTHPYALSPGHKELLDLKFFLQMWKRNDWHSKTLAWLLDEEKRRGG